MPAYTWKGKTRQGTVTSGVMEAANVEAVEAQLRGQMLTPIKVKAKPKDISEYVSFLKQKIKTKDLVIFTRQFATMIDAGLPLVQCLKILGEQQENPTFKKIIEEVRDDVEQGSTFADALSKHPKPFDSLFCNLVAAGEVGGILDTILNRLAAYLEKADALARKVKGAMVYPTTVLVVAVGVVVLLLVKVIPTFEKMFADFGGELPAPADRREHQPLHAGVDRYFDDWGNSRDHRIFSGAQAFVQISSEYRCALLEGSDLRFAAPEGRRGALYPHAWNHDREWCADPGWFGHRCENRRQRDHRRIADQRSKRDCGGADDCGAPG